MYSRCLSEQAKAVNKEEQDNFVTLPSTVHYACPLLNPDGSYINAAAYPSAPSYEHQLAIARANAAAYNAYAAQVSAMHSFAIYGNLQRRLMRNKLRHFNSFKYQFSKHRSERTKQQPWTQLLNIYQLHQWIVSCTNTTLAPITHTPLLNG
ncbi:Protein of unknown function [Pyronema omphalodes CBS 100304]|uniref:Uncharacterized protein n=1 Tax=Pyronema omphalodes (strain CBS 100304) TaxID=1076935 RepID=U4L254_PYROM|nr:Protein of unknown function [Pyronema omphalodes CBS 100304]